MPFINLIEEQRRLSRRNEARTRVSFMASAVTATLVVLGWGALTFRIDRVRSEQAKLHAQIQRQLPLLSEITLNQKESGILEPKVKTLEDGQKQTGMWTNILTHLAKNTPKDTWLTAMRSVSADDETPVAISFIGLSTGQEPVGEYIKRMQNAKDLDGVNLKATRPKDWNSKPYVEFEIVAQVKGSAKPKPVPKPEDNGGKA